MIISVQAGVTSNVNVINRFSNKTVPLSKILSPNIEKAVIVLELLRSALRKLAKVLPRYLDMILSKISLGVCADMHRVI